LPLFATQCRFKGFLMGFSCWVFVVAVVGAVKLSFNFLETDRNHACFSRKQ